MDAIGEGGGGEVKNETRFHMPVNYLLQKFKTHT